MGYLTDIRVVDLTQLAPGPFATTILGDLGADVITVEPPSSRREGSFVGGIPYHGGHKSREQRINPLFRSRRSIVIDLKSAQGKEVLTRLIRSADVFMEGFRPGAVGRLGFDYPAVAEINPSVVYCSLTGYGQTGPMAQKAGHDINYLAEAGLLAITTRAGGAKPGIPLNVVADFSAGGFVAALGVLAALHRRGTDGEGSFVDVSMFDGVLSLLSVAAAWREAGAPDPSFEGSIISGRAPFYDCYRTADDRWLAVGCVEPKFFAALCDVLARPDLVSLQFDPDRWPEIRRAFTEAFAAHNRDEWVDRLKDVDTAVSPVRELGEAFDLARATGRVTADYRVPVPRFTPEAAPTDRYAAAPGQDCAEILGDLGYSTAEIEELRQVGAAGA
jgi:alpha-methylacyl-CoA racemase